MLWITVSDGPIEQRWIPLQGRLAAPWIAKLETNWKNLCRRRDTRRCVVNLSNVTTVDDRGDKVLKAMSSDKPERRSTMLLPKGAQHEIEAPRNSQAGTDSHPDYKGKVFEPCLGYDN